MDKFDNEVSKHKKKKKSSTSKSKSKSKHKHEYEEVLFEYINSIGKPDVSRGTRCKICGKIDNISLIETEQIVDENKYQLGKYRSLSDEEVYEKYKDLEKVYIDSVWQKFAPLEGGE